MSFAYTPFFGNATITDFAQNTATDTIALPKSEFADFAHLLAATVNSGGSTVSAASNGDTLTLQGMDKTTLTGLAADFSFV